jgi:hypothetical protein
MNNIGDLICAIQFVVHVYIFSQTYPCEPMMSLAKGALDEGRWDELRGIFLVARERCTRHSSLGSLNLFLIPLFFSKI